MIASPLQHIVYISFYGASPTATFPYLAGEQSVIRGPAGQGRVAAVAQDDIADVAAVVLQQPDGHAGETYNLTGPESLTLEEVADTLTQVLGRRVIYEPETAEEAYASRRSSGDSQWQLDAWVSTYTAIAAGELERISTAVPDITGHPATSLEKLLRRL